MAVRIAPTEPTRHAFSVDENEKMIEASVFDEDAHIELLDGEIVEMAAIGIKHETCARRLQLLLTERLARSAIVSTQNSVLISDRSLPKPDIALLKWQEDFYSGRRPTAEDALLLIEIADTSLAADRSVKVPLYARAGVREIWLVSLRDKMVDVYSDLGQGSYRSVKQARRGDVRGLPGGQATIRVDEVLD